MQPPPSRSADSPSALTLQIKRGSVHDQGMRPQAGTALCASRSVRIACVVPDVGPSGSAGGERERALDCRAGAERLSWHSPPVSLAVCTRPA